MLELGRYATLKWYDIAAPDAPVPAEIGDLARQCLVDEVMSCPWCTEREMGELAEVLALPAAALLHRLCGSDDPLEQRLRC